MTPREKFIAALERKALPGRIPHFELVFFLTMEVFGKVHPHQRAYRQWDQMSKTEQKLHIRDQAEIYVAIAEKYSHSAIFIQPMPNNTETLMRIVDEIRDISGDKYFLATHGDCTFGVPSGENMESMAYRMYDEPQSLLDEAEQRLDAVTEKARLMQKHGGLDGFILCNDYCLNEGPFLSPALFDKFIFPYLKEIIRRHRELGFYTIKHTDGNIMPILDRLVQANPHGLHSLDPQGGIDIAEVVRLVGNKVALCGNVNCGLMQTGTEREVIESARYAIHHGLKAPGYIFCTSNCIYTGMPLNSYELIHDIWYKEAIRPEA